MVRLDGKVAVVTGAARGLGRAYALALAGAGAAVTVNDLPADTIPASTGGHPGDVVRAIRAQGGRAIAVLESVADPGGVERIMDETLAAFGRLDIAVNNAGIVRSAPVINMSVAEFDAVVAVHARGTFLCTGAALRRMGRGGRIINVTSGAAFGPPYAGTANYAAAKGAIISFTRVVAVEARELGITCNAVAPLARTPMSERHLAGDADPQLDPTALAPLVVFLASDAAAHISGEVFHIARGEIALVRSTIGSPIRSAGEQWTATEIAARITELLPRG